MTSQLSWQPPPVTKCGECRYCSNDGSIFYCQLIDNLSVDGLSADLADETYEQNAIGITPTCPMWQQQNKDHNKGEQA